MPRNSAGVYVLPPTNPVVPFTTIATSWANPTMNDIGAELTNSLDRTGRGGMLAPFRIFDGTISQPGLGFTNEIGLGLWRSGSGTMHLVSSGINQFTITSTGASVSTLRVVTGVGALYKHTGYKNFQTVNVNGVYYIIPSTTVDAEDFNSNLSTTLDSAGNLTVRGTLTVSGSIGLGNTTVNGNLSVTGDETINGKLTVLGSTTTVAIMIAGGITVSGAGFPNTIIDGSSGAINNVGGGHKLEIRGAASSDAYMAFHRPGAFAVYFGLAASGQLSVGGWSLGAVLYRLLTEQNSFVIGALSGNASLNATQQVSAYCFVGKLVALGAWNGGLDMRTAQSVSMSAGSTVQGFTMTAGQIARIEVVGNGPITIIQANSRWAVGSPVWGTVVTIVSVWFDGASYFMATQAHNS